jgi:hypothetical protein
LGETSTVFWTAADRTNYINDAQRLIASVTRGVESTVTGTVSTVTPYLTLPTRVVNAHPTNGFIVDGDSLNVVSIQAANSVAPNWRTLRASEPKWFVVDLEAQKAYVSPIPKTSKSVSLAVAVLPADFATDGTDDAVTLFSGVGLMEKYQGALLQLAGCYALMKERYDGDAERYYQFFIQELQSLGINPNDIPTIGEVKANAELDR